MRATCRGLVAVAVSIGVVWLAVVACGVAAGADAGEADVGAALKKVAGYAFGQSRVDLIAVEGLTASASADPSRRAALAAAMARVLASDATLDAKRFLCAQLGLIGSDAEVPVLAALLADKDLSGEARSALSRIPGEASLAAMRAAVEKTSGLVLAGLINTLGDRRDVKAADAIAKRLTDADAVVAGAAIDALGKIGGSPASKSLAAAKGKLAAALQPVLADALLRCAEGLLKAGNAAEAAGIYQQLSAPDMPQYVRTAAFPGLVACQKDKAAAMLEQALTSKDPALESAAIRCARTAGDKTLTAILADQLPKLSADLQVQMIEALADRGDAAALPAVTRMGASDTSDVRLAALAALGRLGSAETVPHLAALAAKAAGAEQRVIRTSLVRLGGDGVDAGLIVTFAAVRCTTVELKIMGYYGGSPAIRELEIYRIDPSKPQ
ncbi:MAG TPA: HEAT repeat domain-containing protein [Phycisphaerae bacterium]|nr:HEAT repeat domain-containing protein [Phycisphaerae bacterium]